MDELRLLIPDESMTAQIEDYRSAMLAADSSMDGCGSLRTMNAGQWLQQRLLLLKEETCPEGWVPSTQFVAVRQRDQRIVGMIQLRHRLSDYLREFGGHVGYSVRPDERRKGYAAWMLTELKNYARGRGMFRLLVTCDVDNEASRRTILHGGGVFERTAYDPDEPAHLERYWIEL